MVSVRSVSSLTLSSAVCLVVPLVLLRPEALLVLLLSSFILSPRVTFTVSGLLFFLSEEVTVITNCVVEPCLPNSFCLLSQFLHQQLLIQIIFVLPPVLLVKNIPEYQDQTLVLTFLDLELVLSKQPLL